jgi:hypothetical protein
VSTSNNDTDDGAFPDTDIDSDSGASAYIELTRDKIGTSSDIAIVRLNTGKDNAANVGGSMPSSAPAKTSCPVVITSVVIFGIAVITAHCSHLHANRFFCPVSQYKDNAQDICNDVGR